MPTTPNMTLDLPVVSTTPGPTWATAVNEAFDTVDTHDHSTGNGVKITPTGLNINADLPLNQNNVTEVRSVRFEDQGTVQTEATDLGCLQLVGGDLWWVNGNGTGVQITSGAGLSFASLGTIGGDFGQPGVTASVTYSDTTKIFSFLQDSGITAGIYGSKLLIADASSGALAVTITADASTGAYTLTMPIVAPTDNTVLTFNAAGTGTFRTISGTAGEVTVTPSASAHTVSLPSTVTKDLTFSGALSGRGIVPLGAVIATFPSLTGAYACSATTAADANGFVQCAGQTIVDATSPLNGQVIPNINNNAFLMGNATSGSAGGANTKTLTTTELPAHTHDVANVPTSSHTHDMQHVHNHTAVSVLTLSDVRGLYSSDSASSYFSSSTIAFGVTNTPPSNTTQYAERGTSTGGANATWIQPTVRTLTNNKSLWTAGAADSSGTLKTATGAPSAISTLTSASTGTGSAFDIRPSYISARYVMRVK